MRARLDEQAAPPSLKATSGTLGGGCGGGSVPDDESDGGATSGNSNEDGDQEQFICS